jgi:glycosyltransferase involved in cell wall biosynthesis
MPSVTFIIPAYNPVGHLVDIIGQLRTSFDHSDIIVVNDGSLPSCRAIFDTVQEKFSVTVLTHPHNQGKGAALKTGFTAVLDKKHSLGVITLDADGQHVIQDIAALKKAFMQTPNALWIGTREFSSNVPWRSRLGNRVTAFIFKRLFHMLINDTQSGLRAIPAALLPTLLRLKMNGFDFELMMLIQAIECNIPVQALCTQTVYIDNNQSSHFHPIRDSIKIYRIFVPYIFKRQIP